MRTTIGAVLACSIVSGSSLIQFGVNGKGYTSANVSSLLPPKNGAAPVNKGATSFVIVSMSWLTLVVFSASLVPRIEA